MTRLRAEVLVAALVAAVVHALVLGGVRPSGGPAAGRTTAPMLVRVLSIPAATDADAPAAGHETPEVAPALPNRDRDAAESISTGVLRGAPPTKDVTQQLGRRRAQDSPDRPNGDPTLALPGPPQPATVSAAEGLRPAPDYLLGAELDPRPMPLEDIDPVFPVEAGLQEGMVVLRILISEAGSVDQVAVIRSSPPGLFERSAVLAFQNARFSPGMVLGRPVKSQIRVQVDFTPFNRGAVSGRGY